MKKVTTESNGMANPTIESCIKDIAITNIIKITAMMRIHPITSLIFEFEKLTELNRYSQYSMGPCGNSSF